MLRRAHIYDLLSLTMVTSSLVFFYFATQFLVEKDYIAAAVTTFIGIFVVRVGVELAKLTLLMRRRDREKARRGEK